MAAVLTGGYRSKNFKIRRGNRQGCPLSPLIFFTVIEPLAEAIRQDPVLCGVDVAGKRQNISLYADDVLLFISNPTVSIAQLIQTITLFGTFSGYKINYTKSEAMPFGNSQQMHTPPPLFPFKWSPSGFIYLGTFITPKFDLMYKANFNPLLDRIKQDLVRWRAPPLTWLGPIALLKTNILPRLLSRSTHRTVKQLNSWFSSFIWKKQRCLIKMSTLQLPVDQGGLELPDIKK